VVVGNVLVAVKNHVLAIPSRCSRQLVGESDFNVVHRTLDNECRASLTEISEMDFDAAVEAERKD
jgi:hypothetical protein